MLAQDIDPKAHREEQKRENLKERKNTLAVVANELIESKRLKVKKETADTMQLRFDKHLLAKLGDIPLSKIDVRDVELTLRPLVNEGKLETVKRLSTFINEVMRYAFIRRIIPFNHLADISKLFPSPNVRHSPTIPCKELPDFLETLSNANIRPLTRLLILWQLHTMTRPKEAATARWDEIDIESREWVIPAEKMKMKKEHTVYLSDEVIALLREIKDLNTNREYLFPGYRNPRTHVNSEAANTALKRMGYKDRMVAHGMRALSSTTLYESGKFRSEVIEQSLAHAENNEVKAAYNRAKYEVERRELMAWWGKHIQSASLGDMAVVSLD
ncbi:hypothetical protein A3750_22800, partial [Oleiphilus sp. HI0079]|uniref:tyrosine-type recombinase/integrase n=1 Tax=Oleiphilus sp. HI0079 TaxID=1822254 RepID=UPI0007C40D5A